MKNIGDLYSDPIAIVIIDVKNFENSSLIFFISVRWC